MSSREPDTVADRILAADGGFRLSVRTSMVSEFRNAAGALGAFELSHRFASTGALRTTLAQLPGVLFESEPTTLWSSPRNRFTYKNRLFEITVPFADIRIAPAEAGAIYGETEELLRLLTDTLLPKWQARERSRFFRL